MHSASGSCGQAALAAGSASDALCNLVPKYAVLTSGAGRAEITHGLPEFVDASHGAREPRLMTSQVRVRPATLAALSISDATRMSSCRGAGAARTVAAAASSRAAPAAYLDIIRVRVRARVGVRIIMMLRVSVKMSSCRGTGAVRTVSAAASSRAAPAAFLCDS